MQQKDRRCVPMLRWLLCMGLAVGLAGCTWMIEPQDVGGTVPPSTVGDATPTAVEAADDTAGQGIASPDGAWTALLDVEAGSLDLIGPDGETQSLFAAGKGVQSVAWSPDGSHLLIVRSDWQPPQDEGAAEDEPAAGTPPEIWAVDLQEGAVSAPQPLFQPDAADLSSDLLNELMVYGAGTVDFGKWSPSGDGVVFWMGTQASASLRADGLLPFVLDVTTGEAIRVADWALVNPDYHSWSPDGAMLAMTVGSGRSAQANKWLNLVDLESGTVSTVVSKTEQIPGIVAWSPQGDQIAYAAVEAEAPDAYENDDHCCPINFTNPAIVGRRIYLLDVASGETRRLNDDEAFQDAPIWREDGQVVEYVQWDAASETLVLMSADVETGEATALEETRQPAPAADTMVGYYGQSAWDELLDRR